VTANGMAPFTKLVGQGLVFRLQGEVLEILEALMHQIQGVVDQLGGLIGGHGS